MNFNIKNKNKAFTLIELLVTISIISLLSSVVFTAVNGAKVKARDAKRKTDMLQIKMALDLYYNDNGFYPSAYGTSWGGVNSGPSCGTNGTVSGATAYIQGLTPTYIKQLPVDPGPAIDCTGYLYTTNGTNYKLLDHGTPESMSGVGQMFYDPVRPTWSWMVCSGEPACSNW